MEETAVAPVEEVHLPSSPPLRCVCVAWESDAFIDDLKSVWRGCFLPAFSSIGGYSVSTPYMLLLGVLVVAIHLADRAVRAKTPKTIVTREVGACLVHA